MLLRLPLACLLLAASVDVAAEQAASVEAGRRVFARCAGCHEAGPRARNVFGPHLNGIIGRRAGSVPGFGYSDALRKKNIVWNEANLAAFVRDPDEVVPGTKMRFFGFFTKGQMADLMAYLASLPPQTTPPAAAPAPARTAPGAQGSAR